MILAKHQIKTFSAMQQALTMLVEDLDPVAIDQSTDTDRGITALVTSRKARLWDAYVTRWQAKTFANTKAACSMCSWIISLTATTAPTKIQMRTSI